MFSHLFSRFEKKSWARECLQCILTQQKMSCFYWQINKSFGLSRTLFTFDFCCYTNGECYFNITINHIIQHVSRITYISREYACRILCTFVKLFKWVFETCNDQKQTFQNFCINHLTCLLLFIDITQCLDLLWMPPFACQIWNEQKIGL